MPGSGENVVSMVHADDVGAAFCFLAEHPAPGEIFNIADDEPARLGEVVRAQAVALGAPPPRSIPRFVLRLVAGKYSGVPPTAHAAVTNAKLRGRGFQLKYPTYREGVVAVARAQST
jgi:2-alkyl-3-oxoalkanoate reductase